MSKVQWEYDQVERPFCEQLRAMGWQSIEGDIDMPDLIERVNFREVSLTERARVSRDGYCHLCRRYYTATHDDHLTQIAGSPAP